MTSPIGGRPPERSSISFLWDLPNLVTLAGLLCGVSSIYFSSIGAPTAAALALLWALLCDWSDGRIARRMKVRRAVDRNFGGQLDSLADLVCSGVAPGMLLLSVADFDPWFLPGAFVLAVAGAVRLAHFNVSEDHTMYSGLPIDTNIMVVTAVFPFQWLAGEQLFPWLLYVTVVALAALNVAPFRLPKLTTGWFYAVVAYVVGMSLLLARQLI
jgi:archaetidylserine synthase